MKRYYKKNKKKKKKKKKDIIRLMDILEKKKFYVPFPNFINISNSRDFNELRRKFLMNLFDEYISFPLIWVFAFRFFF